MSRKNRKNSRRQQGKNIDGTLVAAPSVHEMLIDGRLTVQQLSGILSQAVEGWARYGEGGRCVCLSQFASHRLFVFVPADPRAAERRGVPNGITVFAQTDVATMQPEW